MSSGEILTFHDEGRRSWAGEGPRPVRTHLWRPARADDAPPTVLLSHGAGGAARQLAWLAEPLAAAGFLVAAVDHHGNNLVDGYAADGFARWWERPRDLSFVLNRLQEREPIGPTGAAGFSMGGYTAAALLGARIDGQRYSALLTGAIQVPPPPEYPTVAEELRARLSEADIDAWAAEAGGDYADERVRAGFLVCPAIAPMLDEGSLRTIERPVAIRWGDADEQEPPEFIALVYAGAIPGAGGQSAGAEVSHFAFLADNPDFGEVRARVAAEAVAFFTEHLR